jgi:HPt (histidine-containing phosphotransfer) domain-containing protein
VTAVQEDSPAGAIHSRQEAKVFDHAGMLDRLMGDEDLERTILGGFLEDIPHQIQAFYEFLGDGDLSNAERKIHTIKGAAANVGGEALRKLAGELEEACRTGDMAVIKERANGLEAEFKRLRDVITDEL